MFRRFLLLLIIIVGTMYFFMIMYIHQHPLPINGFDRATFRIPKVKWCKELHFQVPPSKNVVALVSFPGSGNTWLRYLLQQLTGILTGSVYMDHGLRANGFPAENITNGSVLVVKTHELPPLESNKFTSAILLIRNPRDAILADFNRLHKGHIGTAPKTAFNKKPQNKKNFDWTNHVPTQLIGWETLHAAWLSRFPCAVHVVFYEELVRHTAAVLQGTMRFLNFNYTRADLECAIRNREGIYRRWKKHKDFDPYTKEMYEQIEIVKARVLKMVSLYRMRYKYKKLKEDYLLRRCRNT